MSNLNPEAAHRALVAKTKEAISSHFPIEGRKHRLELLSLDIDEGPEFSSMNFETQAASRLTGQTWGPDIRAKFRLVDMATGKVLDEKTRTLGTLPKITTRYSYIVAGSERQFDGVFRLNPGAYHAEASNGDLLAKWNVAAGSNVGSFKISIERKDPKKIGQMFLIVRSGASSTVDIPVYPVLQAMGVSDSEMRAKFGDEIYEANRKAAKPDSLIRFHKALVNRDKSTKYSPPSSAEAAKYIRDTFEGAEVSPETMKTSLGKGFERITGEALLLSAAKLVGISAGRVKEDDRQSLSNKRLFGAEDFVHEHLTKGANIYALQRKIRNNVDRRERISEIIPAPGVGYGAAILSKFKAGQLPTQTNPLQFIANHTKTTILGADFGGIKGDNINLMQDKLINPSHLGMLDPLQTPETSAGIVLQVPLGARKDGHVLKAQVINVKTGRIEELSAADLEHAVVAYPDQVKITRRDNGTYALKPRFPSVVVYDDERNTSKRPWAQVQYVLPSAKSLFAVSANLIPFLQNDNGNRSMMATKHQEQAVGLQQREAPLVQSIQKGAATYENLVGAMASVTAMAAGTVVSVSKSAIILKGADGKSAKYPLYDHYPLNGLKHMMHSTPLVKPGDVVKRGQVLADSNFTKDGSLALGTNLRVAYLPYKGLNFEDGIVISESAASKLVSSHLHSVDVEMTPNVVVNRKLWRQFAGAAKATPEVLQKLDDNGVIKVGTRVQPGDVLIAKLRKQDNTKETQVVKAALKKAIRDYTDSAEVWDHEYAGEIVRVVNTGKKLSVYIRTEQTMEIGDKLSGRHGNKGIVTKILPDDQMPRDKSGKHVEVLHSPAGIPSRMNVGQILETAAGKIAKKTGKTFTVDNFDPDTDYSQLIKDELKKNKLSDTEELFDPETGESLGQIFTGFQYTLKLDHQAEKKVTARAGGFGYAYRPSGEAAQGSGIGQGGQRIGGLDTYTLLAHGAVHNLREMQTYKSDQEQAEETWLRVMRGERPPPPKVPRSMVHFQYYLRAMGIDASERGGKYSLMPMTDAQTTSQSSGVLALPEKTLAAKGSLTREERGGLFDRGKTGGLDGKKWSHLDLGLRIPNPVFEEPVRLLLRMKKPEFQKLLSESGAQGGKSGFAILEEKLRALDVDKELKKSEASLINAKEGSLDVEYKRVRYLRALKQLKLTPVDAYTNRILPVLPPQLRKVSIGYDGTQIIDPINQMYAITGSMVRQLKDAEKERLPIGDIQKLQAEIYTTVKALRTTGMALEGKQLPSLMDKLTGSKPKHSFFQTGVLGKRQDMSGRSVIIPDPDLPLDEVGVPKAMAMEMYKPFVIRELWRRMGRAQTPREAREMIKQNHPAAIEALTRVVKDRPAIMKRDPALHMFSMLAFHPRLVEGRSIKMHPLVVGGFGADFDGDTMAMYVPISDKAVDEAKGMLPSKNLFSPTSGGLMVVPSQDGVLGIYQATQWGKPKPGSFTPEEAIAQMNKGTLKSYDVISVKGMAKPSTPGRLALNATLPNDIKGDAELLHDPEFRMAKGKMKGLATRVARAHPEEFSAMIDKWKTLGHDLAYKNGSSVSLNDFHDGHKLRDERLKPYVIAEEKIRAGAGSQASKDARIVKLYQDAQKELKEVGTARYDRLGNNGMWAWAQSGAKGNWEQFGQLVMGPILVQDPLNNAVPFPIVKSFGEGLPVSQYWASLHGARKGSIDRASATAKPGALTKDLINTVIDQTIKSVDCGTTKGALLSVMEPDVGGRYLAADVPMKEGDSLKRGTLITEPLRTRLKNSGPKKVLVRSPLACQEVKGICATCYGLNERGTPYAVGANVGVIAGHALGEPITQMQMRTFHTGGVAGTSDVADYFTAAEDLLKVPEKLRGEATLSQVAGKVEKITTDALGGKVVVVAGRPHTVPHTNQLLPNIRIGEDIQKADALSTGRKNPNHILEITKSMGAVRNHITESLNNLYVETTGNERRRNIETVIRAMTDLTKVKDPGDAPGLLRGQILPLSEVQQQNRDLRRAGRKEISHMPTLKPLNYAPLSGTEDWMARLNYQRLKETYVEGGAQNWSSDIHGHPIPGIAHGAAFGLPIPESTTLHKPVTQPSHLKAAPSGLPTPVATSTPRPFSFFGS